MRIGTSIPEDGTVIDWDIDEIMERNSLDMGYYQDWEDLLEQKRMDSHYEDVKASIERWGFVRPLTSYVSRGMLQFGDGHHRLAAAIELGMSTVPVEVHTHAMIAEDSGEWSLNYSSVDSIKSVAVY